MHVPKKRTLKRDSCTSDAIIGRYELSRTNVVQMCHASIWHMPSALEVEKSETQTVERYVFSYLWDFHAGL